MLETRQPPGGQPPSTSVDSYLRSSGRSHSFVDPEIGQSESSSDWSLLASASLASRRRSKVNGRQLVTGGNRAEPKSKEVVKALLSQPIIEQIGSRVQLDSSLEDALQSPFLLNQLQNQLYVTKSTLGNFNDYLENGENTDYKCHFGIIGPLSGIVRRDLMEFMELLHNLLDGRNSEIWTMRRCKIGRRYGGR